MKIYMQGNFSVTFKSSSPHKKFCFETFKQTLEMILEDYELQKRKYQNSLAFSNYQKSKAREGTKSKSCETKHPLRLKGCPLKA